MLEHLVGTKTDVDIDTKLIKFDYCLHPVRLGKICGVCGMEMPEDETVDDANGKMVGDTSSSAAITQTMFGGQKLRVSIDEARRQHASMKKQLIRSQKLSLVLDLDLTLLHCTIDKNALSFAASKGVNDVHEIYVQGIKHFLKIRDVMRGWLKSISDKYLLHIYTHGTREYAEVCAKIMDPDDTLFRRRIISRTDVPELGSIKSLKTVFPMDDKMVVILDDNANVWRGCRNLISVKPYHFFKGMSGVNKIGNEATSHSGGELNESLALQQDNRVDRDLIKIGDLLTWVHDKFYKSVKDGDEDTDVKEILDNLKRRIFRNVWVFVDSVGIDVARTHQYTKKLIEMGARIVSDIDERCTHVIAAVHRSEAALEAKRRSLWVVNPDWILASSQSWHREPEAPFCLFQLKSVT